MAATAAAAAPPCSGYFTRSKALTEHKAAGVLPFAIHEGGVLVLLGAEPCRTGPGGRVWRTMWRDFGGCREAADADSAATAAREFAEETLGLFGACDVTQRSVAAAAAGMEATLRDPLRAVKVVHALKRGHYDFYLTQTHFLAPLMFRLATHQNLATHAVQGAEKTAFAWVPLAALLECVAVTAPRYFLDTRAHVCGGYGTPQPAMDGRRRFQLHPCFANSLRTAQKCGLDGLLARARELPLPAPPPLPLAAAAGTAADPAAVSALRNGAASASAGQRCGAAEAEQAAAAVAAAAAAAVAASGGEAAGDSEQAAAASRDCCSEMEGVESSSCRCDAVEGSLTYWLSQGHIAAALRAGTDGGGGSWDPPDAEALDLDVAERQQQQQQQRGHPQQRRQAPPSGSSPGAAAASSAIPECRGGVQGAPAASASSGRPASSMDTASSLRHNREAVAAAAVEQVVNQIQRNSTRRRQRLSRKQRQKQRRQRQRQRRQEVAAAAAEAAAAAAATVEGAAAAADALQRELPEGAATCGEHLAAALRWQHAAAEVEAAFQPRMRLLKRQRVAVAAG